MIEDLFSRECFEYCSLVHTFRNKSVSETNTIIIIDNNILAMVLTSRANNKFISCTRYEY